MKDVDTATSIVEEAKKELREAKARTAKTKIVEKLKQLDAAQTIVKNLERELEVLTEQVEADLKN
jgi:flagellin-specific chaperone FliS